MIYKEDEIEYDVEKTLNMHIYAYFGELEQFKKFLDETLIKEFKETLRYCITKGCLRNKEFMLFCESNFYFKDEEYNKFLKIAKIIHGELKEKDELKENLTVNQHTYDINDKNLKKICEIGKFNFLSEYLCTLANNKKLFEEIQNRRPEPKDYTDSIILYYGLENLHNGQKIHGNFKYGIRWFPIDIKKYGKFTDESYKFTEEIFEQELSIKNLREIYGDYIEGKYSILEMSNIKNLPNYIYLEKDIPTDKEINEYNILNDIRVCKKAEKIKKWENIAKCKLFLMFDDLDIIKNNMFLEWIYSPYNKELIPYVTEQQKWSMIYSLTLSYLRIKNFIQEFDYIEISVLQASYEAGNRINIMELMKKYEEKKKCYKILDLKNKKYIKKEVGPDEFKKYIDKIEIKFNIKNYKYIY